ncbi:hypothetical protein QIS74_04213 [Colletotrichum tabaci]|uniref:Uncharacterized protein n=1 Tax=Colletotrichum tabaci TaxID=1209068 RepID=A0AAV9TMD4_9PEZI
METFPQECLGPGQSRDGAAPYPVRAIRSRRPSLHLKPAATALQSLSRPTCASVLSSHRVVSAGLKCRGYYAGDTTLCRRDMASRYTRHTGDTTPEGGPAPPLPSGHDHGATAHRKPRAQPQVQLPVTATRLRIAADHVLQSRGAEQPPRRHDYSHSVH